MAISESFMSQNKMAEGFSNSVRLVNKDGNKNAKSLANVR